MRKAVLLCPRPHKQEHGGDPVIPFSGSFEAKLFDMPDDEKEAYCKEVGTAGGHWPLPLRFDCLGPLGAPQYPALGPPHIEGEGGVLQGGGVGARRAGASGSGFRIWGGGPAASHFWGALKEVPPNPLSEILGPSASPRLLIHPQVGAASALPKIIVTGFKAVHLIYL